MKDISIRNLAIVLNVNLKGREMFKYVINNKDDTAKSSIKTKQCQGN